MVLVFFLEERLAREIVLRIVVPICAGPGFVMSNNRSHHNVQVLGGIYEKGILSRNQVSVCILSVK